MFSSDEEIYLTAIKGAFFITFLITVIIIAIIKYYNRLKKHQSEVITLENNYQKEMLKTQIEIQEQTFHNISQEIHDNLGQSLSLVKLNLNRLKLECIDRNAGKVDNMINDIGKVINDMRSLSKSLNSDYLINVDIYEAVNFEIERIQRTGFFAVEFKEKGDRISLAPQKKLILIRTLQETFNNIIKHSEADIISISLNYKVNDLILLVEDNGKGFDIKNLEVSNPNSSIGVGLKNMSRRAELIGGKFSIKSSEGKGTKVIISIPINS